jgi:hypothetical protein
LSPGRINNFLFFTASRLAAGPTQPSIQWVPEPVSLRVKQPRREAHHSPTASAEVEKTWIYTAIPPKVFMVWGLISYAKGQLYRYFNLPKLLAVDFQIMIYFPFIDFGYKAIIFKYFWRD